jgi:hypothetical protein
MPAGVLVTVPLPEPVFATVSEKLLNTNVAVTLRASLIVTVQLAVPVHAPLQPVNVELLPADAVKETIVPMLYVSTQSSPQLIPVGALVTVPVPVPALVTVKVLNVPRPASATTNASVASELIFNDADFAPPVVGVNFTRTTHCDFGASADAHVVLSSVKLLESTPENATPL